MVQKAIVDEAMARIIEFINSGYYKHLHSEFITTRGGNLKSVCTMIILNQKAREFGYVEYSFK